MVPMIAMKISGEVIVFLCILYVLISVRLAYHAGKTGRSTMKWFFISLLLTGIPVLIVFMIDRIVEFRRHRRTPGRRADKAELPKFAEMPIPCPHCQGLFLPASADETAGVKTCPHCGLAIDETRNA